MIASAVLIPDNNTEPTTTTNDTSSPSPSLKRKLSSTSSGHDDTKRPRTSHGPDVESPEQSKNSASPTQIDTDTRQVRRSLPSLAEEKSRSRRLFSSLLGTLSQPASRTSSKRNSSLTEPSTTPRPRPDLAALRTQRAEALKQSRAAEQKRWDEDARQLRWQRMRDNARFLRTKAEPRLCYLPYELSEVEERAIEEEKRRVENEIENEKNPEQQDGQRENGDGDGTQDAVHEKAHGDDSSKMPGDIDSNMKDESHDPEPQRTMDQQPDLPPLQEVEDVRKDDKNSPHVHEDDHGGELEEGQEDDVIY